MERNAFNLNHLCFTLGAMGRLKTLSRIPVLPGDSMNIDLAGIWRLAPLRRELIIDSKVDLFAFYVPHRHIYGDDFVDFIKDGNDESKTFEGVTNSDLRPYLACHELGTLPLWVVAGYNQIWNRYFRAPTADGDIVADDYLPSANSDASDHGYKCGWLPRMWSATIDGNVVSSDTDVDVNSNTLSLLDLEKQKAHLKTERQREWYARRYTDVLKQGWKSGVNIDADQRPQLVWKTSFWMSGSDVDGTGNDNLGQYAGKSMALGGMRMPHKYFNEHGTLWVMALVRYPTIFDDEKHYLDGKVNPSYKEWAGDYNILEAEPPQTISVDDFFRHNGSNDIGMRPYGDWLREHPTYVDKQYDDLDGFPFFSKNTGKSKSDFRYVDSDEYDEAFQTTQLAHWRAQLMINILAKRYIPKPQASIFAGTR